MLRDPEKPRSPAAVSIADDPFYGGGEAGAILRSIDWTAKPIGPVAQWPQSLRTALSICLASRHPICILWGPDRLYFYNDAYAPIVGAKHPWALGESYITVWPEIWDSVIRPILEEVESTGRASWADNLLLVLRRHGYNEECYFAFSFAPTRIEDGSVGGVFTAITETTQQVVGERRLRTLRDLGTRTPEAKSAEDACRIANEVLAANRFDVPFALFYLVSADGKTAERIEQTDRLPDAVAPRVVTLDRSEGDDPWGFREAVRQTKPLVRTGLTERFGALTNEPWPEPVHTAVVLPIARPGETVPYGFIVSGTSPRRPLDRDYESFLELAAGLVATAISNARAYAEERRRAEALAQLDRAKTDFFSNVSHEFRTPLALMLGPLEELIARGSGSESDPDVREQLHVAHRNSLRLLKLVNSLLDFSRIEAGRMEASYEPVDLAALTSELASMFRAAMEKAGLRLVVACEPVPEAAYVDHDMWEKIVFNLLSNAYKFTQEGEIVVHLQMSGTHFELAVRDTGAGIAPENQRDVFKRFHRVPDTFSRTHEGTGIGLALVHELTRLHGGTVELDSRPGEGSTFTVKIPRGCEHLPANRIGAPRALASTSVKAQAYIEEAQRWLPPPEPATPASSESAPSVQRVLIVDDNADMRDYVQRLLQDHYETQLAEDGQKALALARNWQPDLVLTDVMMPKLDGMAFIRELRADPRTKTTPVILLSARAGEEARIEGLAAGADDYLTKPFGARELLARVQSHLHLARLRHEAEAQITATEARFEQLVSMMPAGVVACSANGRITYFNRRAAEIWRAEPRAGEHYVNFAAEFKLLSADGSVVPTDERHMALALREGRRFQNTEALMERPDGSRFIGSFNIAPTYDGNGRINGAINVFQDVTAERQAREALRATEERYRAVFQQASVGILECELNGRISRTNPALSQIVGFTTGELRQKNWRDLIHPDELAADEALAQQLATGGADSIRAEQRYRRADGSFGWADILATLIRDAGGEPAYGLAVIVDISERKRAEEELKRARDEAISASRAKDDFLAALSHELRTPLSPVLLLASEAAVDERLPSRVRADFETIRKSVELEARLIDDLLDLTRITRNKLVLDRRDMNIAAVIHDSLSTVRAEFSAKQIQLEIDLGNEPLFMRGDPVRLQQVFWNVLKNAVKFTPAKGRVAITSRPSPDRKFAVIEVSDTGIGITQQELERVFEAFSQGDHARAGGSHRFGGLGLGLAISRRVVELHGGRIEAESTGRDHGATFRIELPLGPHPRPQATAPAESKIETADAGAPSPALVASSISRGRILLVEDHPATRAALENLLRRRRYDVRSAASVAEARDVAQKGDFDLMISDIGLPDGNGYELMNEFRQAYGLRGIALSGYGMEDDVSRSEKAGFLTHLTKPVRMQSLDKALAAIQEPTNPHPS